VKAPQGDVQDGNGVPQEGHDEAAKRSEGSEPSRSEAASSSRGGAEELSPVVPDPEIPDKAKRRTFTAEYKTRILEETDKAAPGEIGAILRREGLYSSHLVAWRRDRRRGTVDALATKRRGPPPKRTAAEVEFEKLQRENARLQEELRKARLIIDVQKKLARMLGSPIEDEPSEGRSSS
jgi:transposase